MIVTKFGGTSVADAAAIGRLCDLVATRREDAPLVVVSAMSGVTDRLAAAFEGGQPRRDLARDVVRALDERHRAVMPEVAGQGALARLDPWIQGLRTLANRGLVMDDYCEWMACGELLSSTVVAAALEAGGLPVSWFDARHVVRTVGARPAGDRPDHEAIARLARRHLQPEIGGDAIVVTQGFIASDSQGRTTLLGRGGSDLTASLLARTLGAARLEIWTDVDGVLTGPPALVPTARRLKLLSFAEAAELAYFGAKVLHPATLRPAAEAGIPVLVANSRRAGRADDLGTTIVGDLPGEPDERSMVKSVAVKRGITVITVHSTRMLMAHGFLARIFAVFDKHETAVDLVSTSEVSVSLTVDDAGALDAVLEELDAFARVEVDRGMSIVCVVGEGMRGAPGIPGRVFRAVGEANVRMIGQGASEINLSLVVPETEADDVVRRLHDEFFRGNLPRAIFGESYDELERVHGTGNEVPPAAPHRLAAVALPLAERHGTPLYVYELDVIEQRIERLRAAVSHPRFRLIYACKANFHPAIVRLMAEREVGIDAVSPMETERALDCGVPAASILFTANNVPGAQVTRMHDLGVRVNLGSLSDVDRFAAARPGSGIFLRLNPGVGDGHHEHVVTGGGDSKFGLPAEEIAKAQRLLATADIRVVGLHAHIGSGILEPTSFLEAARRLCDVAVGLPDLEAINFGGGLGIPYRPDEEELDVEELGRGLEGLLHDLEEALGREISLMLEPGRYLVAQAGTLLARVICRKETGGHVYVGLDTGLNHLLRPALYGSYHGISNLTAPEAEPEFVDVVGNICETSDVFAFNRPLPSPREGHLLGIHDVGAYGFAMASHYNLWPLPREVVLRNGRDVGG